MKTASEDMKSVGVKEEDAEDKGRGGERRRKAMMSSSSQKMMSEFTPT